LATNNRCHRRSVAGVTINADQFDAGQQAACGRQEHPVGSPKRGPPDLAAKHCDLVSEDDDLEVLRAGRSEPQEEQLQDALERDAKNRQNHGTSDVTTRGPLFYAIELTHPTGPRGRVQGEQYQTAT
jgi:hypothetical protein